ncbi:MAG: NfeD family protein [Candidatus Adiutrix sp.]|jgi:membrane protein implicated in regulation of membrane protease activity|nr:NfeD family protein [Candidatus Adiutrix sp.]
MTEFTLEPGLCWFLLGIVFLVLEALTPGFFLVFFGLGAWVVSLLLLFLNLDQIAQWLIFIAVSVAALLIFRQKFKALLRGRLAQSDNLDDPVVSSRYLGREVSILKEAGPGQPGLAELDGTNWQVRTDGPHLPAGARAKVVGLDGLTLIVTSL